MHRNVVGRCYFGVVFVGLAVYIFLFHMVGLLFQNGEAESVVTIQYLCVVWCFFFFFVLLHTDILPTTIQSSLPWYVLSSLSSCKDGQWVYTYSFFPRVGLLSLQCIFLHCLRLLDFAFCLLIMQPPIFRPETADLKTFCFSSFDNKLLVYHKYSCIIVSMVELVSSVSLLEIVTFHYELIMLLR